ncbi:MAG: indoleamine 2,3-dioxygenase [Magnetovibrio sp.]|nr:indoleamine 2,3-dioxygenase [Magnetovibrio sp.]
MNLSTYTIDLQRGFLPVRNPLKTCGIDAFDNTVGAMALNLPKVLLDTKMRDVIADLPEFAIEELIPTLDLEQRAVMMRAYSYLTHAYVWGAGEPAMELPHNIARPFVALANHLGRPPVLSYDSYALHNWRLLDPSGPIEVGNIALIQNFLGGLDEEWFILIHVDIEAKAAPAVVQIPELLLALKREDADGVLKGLEVIEHALDDMRQTMARMTEHCDPYIYYQRVRPYIHGWKNNPALPDGLIYQGVDNEPKFYRGETGAQSTIIPLFDAVLGIDHEEDELRTYLMEMRDYMPTGHRAFLDYVERQGSVRDFVSAQGKGVLRGVYNACVNHIAQFRALHLEFAASYIYSQAEHGDNPVHVGTGGTPFMKYLKKHRDESSRHLIGG